MLFLSKKCTDPEKMKQAELGRPSAMKMFAKKGTTVEGDGSSIEHKETCVKKLVTKIINEMRQVCYLRSK